MKKFLVVPRLSYEEYVAKGTKKQDKKRIIEPIINKKLKNINCSYMSPVDTSLHQSDNMDGDFSFIYRLNSEKGGTEEQHQKTPEKPCFQAKNAEKAVPALQEQNRNGQISEDRGFSHEKVAVVHVLQGPESPLTPQGEGGSPLLRNGKPVELHIMCKDQSEIPEEYKFVRWW